MDTNFWLLLFGVASMGDGLFGYASNPASAFAFGLGLSIPGMIDATRWWLSRLQPRRAK